MCCQYSIVAQKGLICVVIARETLTGGLIYGSTSFTSNLQAPCKAPARPPCSFIPTCKPPLAGAPASPLAGFKWPASPLQVHLQGGACRLVWTCKGALQGPCRGLAGLLWQCMHTCIVVENTIRHANGVSFHHALLENMLFWPWHTCFHPSSCLALRNCHLSVNVYGGCGLW